MIGKKYIFYGKKAIDAEALLIVENELALFTSDCKYNATVMSLTRRGPWGLSTEPHHKTKAFQGLT